jgi:hypothetical protein
VCMAWSHGRNMQLVNTQQRERNAQRNQQS